MQPYPFVHAPQGISPISGILQAAIASFIEMYSEIDAVQEIVHRLPVPVVEQNIAHKTRVVGLEIEIGCTDTRAGCIDIATQIIDMKTAALHSRETVYQARHSVQIHTHIPETSLYLSVFHVEHIDTGVRQTFQLATVILKVLTVADVVEHQVINEHLEFCLLVILFFLLILGARKVIDYEIEIKSNTVNLKMIDNIRQLYLTEGQAMAVIREAVEAEG